MPATFLRLAVLLAFPILLLAPVRAPAGEVEWQAHMDIAVAAEDREDFSRAAESYEHALREIGKFARTDKRRLETLSRLADTYYKLGRDLDGDQIVERGVLAGELVLGPDTRDFAMLLENVGRSYERRNRLPDAERLYKRLEADSLYDESLRFFTERGRGGTPDAAGTLRAIADLRVAQGRYVEGESLYRRSLEIVEKFFGPDDVKVGASLNSLAGVYQEQSRYAEAEPLYRRSFSIIENALGPDHPNVGTASNNLALLYLAQARYADAEPLFRRSLTITERARGPEHPSLGISLHNLGLLYIAQKRYVEGAALYHRSIAIFEKALGAEHPSVGSSRSNLAVLYQWQGRFSEADAQFVRSLAIAEKALGPDHPAVSKLLGNLAHLYRKQKRLAEGLELARRATKALGDRFATREEMHSGAVLSEQRGYTSLIEGHVSLLVDTLGPSAEAGAEGFEVSQLARASDTAEHVARMAARYASESDALAQLARARQDGIARTQAIDTRLVQAASRAPKDRDVAAEARLRAEDEEAKKALIALDARMEKEFPQYRELTSPRPLALADAQKLLGAEEALVALLVSGEESFLWVLRKDAALFEKLSITRRELDAMVRKLRAQLDLGADEPERILARPFDVALAHELYRKVLAPGEKLLAGVKHLIVVPDGALSSLPLGVLVTEAAAQGPSSLADHAKVAWLAKKYAITTLPSVGSLRALRAFAKGEPGRDPFLGFGDPVLEGSGDGRRRTIAALYSRGAVADANEVRKLARLPETADELKAIATTLRAPTDRVRLGAQATERAVKEADLSRHRTLAFATHGLMAGDFKGLAEPALVLTPPEKGSELDDGLLTAGEISQLKLNADWVILSACNTAAPDGTPGADGLSGLAKAFFYAGARSLLVSHWAVSSEASVALTTRMFAEADKGASKAEALRRSMLSLMETPGKPHFAHPAFWAPFVVVGEGNSAWAAVR